MRLVLLGPPGSGKGTQAATLSGRIAAPVIAMGERFRRLASGSDPAARALAARLARGDLLDDDFVVDTVNTAVAETGGDGYILDGFPRTVAQARHPLAPPVDVVVYLAVPDDVVRDRLARRAHEGRPDDADPVIVEHRLRAYHAETEPLLDHYRDRRRLVTVDAAQPPEAVTAAIVEVVDPGLAGPGAG